MCCRCPGRRRSPCDTLWNANGVVAEAEANKNIVITGKVDIDLLYENREKGAAPTFRDRTRRDVQGRQPLFYG